MRVYQQISQQLDAIKSRLAAWGRRLLLRPASKPTTELAPNAEGGLKVDTASPIRLGIRVLGIGFGIFLIWAAFAPLDEGVPTQGAVSIETKRKVIQHLSGGIIKQVHVKEGQLVKQDELLITMDDSMAKARYEEIRQRYFSTRAQQNRLQAEQMGASKISFSEDLLKMKQDPLVAQHMLNQEMLLNARRSSLHAETQAMEESIKAQEAMIEGFQGMLESKRNQLSLLTEQLKGVRELADEGFAPRSQQRDLELRVVQVNGEIAETSSNLLKAKRAIAELKQRITLRKQEYLKEIETQMAQVKQEVDADADKFVAFSEEYQRTEIRSPVAGQVVGLQFQTVGAVIQPGQRVMDVVPLNEGLLLEAKINPILIDRVHVGQEADVRFSGFANSPQLVVDGKIESISKDLISDAPSQSSPNGESYYLARIVLTQQGLEKLGNRTLQPGMPVQVVIKTGERSLLTYLLHPLMKRLAASLKEE